MGLVENDVKGDERNTLIEQILNKAGMKGARPFPGFSRKFKVVTGDLVHGDNYDLSWNLFLSSQLKQEIQP